MYVLILQQQKTKSMYENDESSKTQIFGLWVYKKARYFE